MNVADWVTRPRLPREIGPKSIWQSGPEFLAMPEQTECNVLDIPEMIKRVMVVKGESTNSPFGIIDVTRFSSYLKLIETTARVLSVLKREPTFYLLRIKREPKAKDYASAVNFWIHECQHDFIQEEIQQKYKRLTPHKRSDGVWVVGSRSKKWIAITEDHNEPILLPYEHPFTRLYAQFIHIIAHCGVATTISKIRLKYWIVNLKRMVKSIVHHCLICQRHRKETVEQIMGDLPINRCKPAPPWYSISIDLFGPYDIRGSVNKRARRKVYGVIFNCLVTRAVHTDVCSDYSTDAFMMVLRRFVSIRGYPAFIYSDNDSQLKGASRELKEIRKGLDWERWAAFGSEQGTDWNFSAPDSPWRNGCAESLIKSTKKALVHAVGKHILTFDELQTFFYESAELLNERPIGKHPTSPEDNTYLCPNDLLLGRATSRVPGGHSIEYVSCKRRFLLVQEITKVF